MYYKYGSMAGRTSPGSWWWCLWAGDKYWKGGQRGHLSEMFYFVLKTQNKELMKHYQQFDKTWRLDNKYKRTKLTCFLYCGEKSHCDPQALWSPSLSTPLTWSVGLFKTCAHLLLQPPLSWRDRCSGPTFCFYTMTAVVLPCLTAYLPPFLTQIIQTKDGKRWTAGIGSYFIGTMTYFSWPGFPPATPT